MFHVHLRVILLKTIICGWNHTVIPETVEMEKPIHFLEDSIISSSELKRKSVRALLRIVVALFTKNDLIWPHRGLATEMKYFNSSVG